MLKKRISTQCWSKLLTVVGVGVFAQFNGFAQSNYTTNATNNDVTQIITDYNGYWNSTSISNAVRPNNRHHVLGFQHGSTIYSTGVNDGTLTSQGLTFSPAEFRALPFPSIGGNLNSSAVYIVAGGHLDGNPTAGIHTASTIANLTPKDVLMDGIRGLDIGTGVTNIQNSTPMVINATITDATKISDDEPDFLFSQIADPSTSGIDMIALLDANGQVVGNAVIMNFSTISTIGRYDMDLFTLPNNQPYDTAKPNGSVVMGHTYRDIRLSAVKLSQFGITAANMHLVARIRITKGSNADPAFYAFNENSISIGDVPVITAHPTSVVTCTDGTESATFTVEASGTDLTYEWRFNGVAIPGATSATYTIPAVTQANSGEYTVWVRNSVGETQSAVAYLNVRLSSTLPNINTCQNTASSVSVFPVGTNIAYQWYTNSVNSVVGATPISGATSNTFSSFNHTVPGTNYYFVRIHSIDTPCNSVDSNVFTVTFNPVAVAGTASSNQTICAGSSTSLTLAGHSGAIRWQYALVQTPNTWVDISGTAGSQATLAISNLTGSRRYRAQVSRNTCNTVTSNIVTVTVNETNTWTGTQDTNWSTAANWSCGSVPSAVQSVVIPVVASSNYPQAVNATVKNLDVNAGASLTVTGRLQTSGNLVLNGTPDFASAVVEFAGTAAQTVEGNATVRQIEKNTAGTVTLAGNLYVNESVVMTNGTLASNGHLTFGSDDNGTAIANLSNGATITGAVTAERYLGARRAYRHLSSSTSGGTIYANWQEAGNANPGYGVFITGTGAAAAGFDTTPQNSASLFTMNTTSGAFDEIANTNATALEAGKGYRLFVRGDRTINLTSNSATPTTTVLRSTGTLFQSNYSVSDLNNNVNGWSLVGNPYQNQLNLRQALSESTGLNPNYAWVWDPYMNTRGGYVIVDLNANTNNVSGSQANATLLAGEAVMLRTLTANPTLTFTTAHLTNGLVEPSIMSEAVDQLRLTLRPASSDQVLDGALIKWGTSYSSEVDAMDANKLSNQDETIAIRQNDRNYGIQYRAVPVEDERIALYHANYRHTDYVYHLELTNYTGPQAYLFDVVTQTYTELNEGVNSIPFTVQANEPSPRFELVFQPSALSTGQWSATAVRVYPNPVIDQRFTVQHPAGDVQKVVLYNLVGQTLPVTTVAVSATQLEVKPQGQWNSGVYMLELTIDGKKVQTKLIID